MVVIHTADLHGSVGSKQMRIFCQAQAFKQVTHSRRFALGRRGAGSFNKFVIASHAWRHTNSCTHSAGYHSNVSSIELLHSAHNTTFSSFTPTSWVTTCVKYYKQITVPSSERRWITNKRGMTVSEEKLLTADFSFVIKRLQTATQILSFKWLHCRSSTKPPMRGDFY